MSDKELSYERWKGPSKDALERRNVQDERGPINPQTNSLYSVVVSWAKRVVVRVGLVMLSFPFDDSTYA